MPKKKSKLQYTKIPAKKTSFFALSSEFGDIASFRRILSILRLKNECETIVRFDTTINIEETGCPEKGEGRRCDSCDTFIEYMKQQKGNLQLVKKTCSRLFFFSCKIGKTVKVTADKHQKYFLGFCEIHQDTLNDSNISKHVDTYKRAYVTECVLKGLSKDIRGYKYGNISCDVNIGDESFSIKGGNYFTQQNGLTNCCAHAAIKTALRGYDETISCDKINKVLIESKKEQCDQVDEILEVTRMARGLTPNEMLAAIKKISDESPNLPSLSPLLFTAHDLPITSFVEIIYRAIESKIPVILLFRIPDHSEITNYYGGHAVSLVGHTFNEHNWCAYGSGYFSSQRKASYLSSYLWCDNYVVQDDNFGPAYHLPCSFLSDYYEYGVAVEKLGLNIASQKSLEGRSPNYPLAAIIIPPAELENIIEKLYVVEQVAAKYFVQQLSRFSRDKAFDFNEAQKELFDRYFYYIFKYKLTKPRVFITRTLLVSKQEYLSSSVKDIYSNNYIDGRKIVSVLDDDILSDFFWITEVSVPELYWVNNGKIGEIIINPDLSHGEGAEIQLIRLPFFLALYPDYDMEYYHFKLENQSLDSTHIEILRKKKGIIRQLSVV